MVKKNRFHTLDYYRSVCYSNATIFVVFTTNGEVAERFKATVLKTVAHESGPWVRIPPSPPAGNKVRNNSSKMRQEVDQQFNQSGLGSRGSVKRLIFVSIISSVLSALIVGGTVYFILNNSHSKKQAQLNNQLSFLQNQIGELKSSQVDKQGPVNEKTTDLQLKKITTLTKIKDDGRYVYYSGSITVSGNYRELLPETLLGGELCFYPDSETGYLIPRDPNLWGEGNGDGRAPWFCFKNQDKAKEMFGINDTEIFSDKTIECVGGKAVIIVSNYVVNKSESEVFDTANLDRIISKENYSSQQCQ